MQYTVQSGDNLSSIGARYGVNYTQITGYKSGNPNLIYPGEVLNIPDKTPTAPTQPQPTYSTPTQPVQNNSYSQPQQTYSQPQTSIYQPAQQNSQPKTAQDLVNMGFYGYAGWDDAGALANFNSTGGAGKGGGGSTTGGSGIGQNFMNQPTINLQSIYDTALQNSDVTGLQAQSDAVQKQIDQRRNDLATASADINDNPFYSEATRVGRIAKLNDAAQQDIGNLINQQSVAQNKVSQAKADAQVKLNIGAQQYNIQSQQYQQNLTLFNNLLTSGALNNVSGGDIGQIALATGLTSTMIQSIIDTTKAKNAPKPQLVTIDDGTNQKVVAIDPNTGKTISEQILGASTKAQTASTQSYAQQKDVKAQSASADMSSLINSAYDSTGKYNPALQKGGDGKLSPQAYDYYRALWLSLGLSTKDFEAQFGYLKNPTNPYY